MAEAKEPSEFVIYTDGQQWALYRFGERPGGQPIVRLHDDPTTKGKVGVTEEDANGLERMFRDFLGWQPSVPHQPALLAQLSRSADPFPTLRGRKRSRYQRIGN